MTGNADWSIAVGVLVYIIAIIIAIIYYLRYKKYSIIVFISSVATYIFAVFYSWDVFDLNKNWVLSILIISTILMMFLGKYFSSFKFKLARIHTSLKEDKDNN